MYYLTRMGSVREAAPNHSIRRLKVAKIEIERAMLRVSLRNGIRNMKIRRRTKVYSPKDCKIEMAGARSIARRMYNRLALGRNIFCSCHRGSERAAWKGGRGARRCEDRRPAKSCGSQLQAVHECLFQRTLEEAYAQQ